MSKREIIDKSIETKCWTCNGEKITFKWVEVDGKMQQEFETCSTCNGTGIWKEENYILVAEDSKGSKIAFQVDNLGK